MKVRQQDEWFEIHGLVICDIEIVFAVIDKDLKQIIEMTFLKNLTKAVPENEISETVELWGLGMTNWFFLSTMQEPKIIWIRSVFEFTFLNPCELKNRYSWYCGHWMQYIFCEIDKFNYLLYIPIIFWPVDFFLCSSTIPVLSFSRSVIIIFF